MGTNKGAAKKREEAMLAIFAADPDMTVAVANEIFSQMFEEKMRPGRVRDLRAQAVLSRRRTLLEDLRALTSSSLDIEVFERICAAIDKLWREKQTLDELRVLSAKIKLKEFK
ncbi:MAG: hypothetical protein Q7R39_12640 [Dehalococcoidia bacterium]|nr:hypothetical protein [Dehalococcoidia bacterium]